MGLPRINESLIHKNCTDQSFQRGQEYVRSQSVRDLIWRDPYLQASVVGSDYYRVTIKFKEQTTETATCTCPYDWGSWCKHIVAVLLQAQEQANIEERPSLHQMLEHLNLEQTRELLYQLVTANPELIDQIDLQVATLETNAVVNTQDLSSKLGTEKINQLRIEIDRSPFARHVSSLVRQTLRGRDYDEEDSLSDELDEEISKVKKFIAAGDSFRAFLMAYAIAEGLVEYVDDIAEYYGDASDLVWGVDRVMAEAILCTDFSKEERQKWQTELEATQDVLGTELNLSIAALIQGWDDPEVQSALQSESKLESEDAKNRNAIQSNFVNQLTPLRLDILESQERFEEYLNLAKSATFTVDYINMLIRVGCIDQAIAASKKIKNDDEAFKIAKQFLKYGVETQALEIAVKGLQIQNKLPHYEQSKELAIWTANLAESLGETDICINAKVIAFKLKPSLSEYHQIRNLAQDQWQSIKPDLLNNLVTANQWGSDVAKIDIFLEEEMIDQAIAITDFHGCKNPLKVKVMQAAITKNPDWVISKASAIVADILNRGQSNAYEEAIAMLEQTRKAYLAKKTEQKWLSYRSQIVSTHGKKRKFMELLKLKKL